MLRYAITDGTASPLDHSSLRNSLQRWVATRVDFVQLREKHLPDGPLLSLARDLVGLLKLLRTPGEGAGTPGTRLLVNGHPEIAAAAAADGVHISSGAGMEAAGRVRLAYANAGLPAPVLSISCHSLEEVQIARDGGVDLILFGPVFEKRVHGRLVRDGDGLESLQRAFRMAGGIPLLALGGVRREDAAACVSAGAAGVAGIRLFS